MIFLLIAIVALCICILLLKKSERPEKREFLARDDQDFLSGIRKIAKEMRATERGRLMPVTAMLPTMRRAYALVSAKVKKNRAITEGEKWYYENFYRVRRRIDGISSVSLSRLPFAKGTVRIITVMRYLVENSTDGLNRERLEKALDTVNGEIALTYEEIRMLPEALGYALTEGAYALANRILYYNKMATQANRGGRIRWDSDIYLYFYSLNSPNALQKFRAKGIDPETVSFHYSLSVVETARLAKYLFTAYGDMDNLLSPEKLLGFCKIDKIYAKSRDYQNVSIDTKRAYLERTAKLSERLRIAEPIVAKAALDMSDRYSVDLYEVLFAGIGHFMRAFRNPSLGFRNKQNDRVKQFVYVLGLPVLAVGLGAGVFFATGAWHLALFGALCGLFVLEKAYQAVLSQVVSPRVLPRLKFSEVPYEHRTMIVVSAYITSLEQMKEAKEHLETLLAAAPERNVSAALLIDFKRAKAPVMPEDAALLEEAKNMPEGCYAFVRNRVNIDGEYGAWERKRGAILALCKFFETGYRGDFTYFSKGVPSPAYIVALDEDNVLTPGSVLDFVNIMAHPANQKYDLVAFRSKYNQFSFLTPYSSRYLEESGYEQYPNFTGLIFNLFGRDIFCGKGIFRVGSFYRKLDGIFPEKKILSHDIIEGAVLNTASAGVVYEDAPQNYSADHNRTQRWMRGDIQLLPFAKRKWKNTDGEDYRSEIEPIYRTFILRNALKTQENIWNLVLGILGVFLPLAGILFAAVRGAQLVVDLILWGRQCFKENVRIRYVVCGVLKRVGEHIIKLALLPYEGFSDLWLTLRTTYRMIAGKNLLEWKTYRSVQGKAENFGKFLPTFLFLAGMIAVTVFLGFWQLWSMGCYAIFCVFCYALILELGKMRETKEKLSAESRERCLEYAQKTFRYFRFMAEEGELIADNLQVKPYKGNALTTSSTNLGFQLLAEICALTLGFIDERECFQRLHALLRRLEDLPKWYGNLYNWYRVEDGKPALPFVSSVDSGNFVAALYVVAGFAKEKAPAIAACARALAESTDLSKFYDAEKGLFYLGYDTAKNVYDGHYDLLASESRMLSLLYLATGGEPRHWNMLGRDLGPSCGNTLLSWSGTMFEYCLPELFLKSPARSLVGKSVRNAVYMQTRKKIRGVWGLSESGYYAFDDFLRYQYRAFGLSQLALGTEKERAVISPYSSFLAMEYLPKLAEENLKRIDKMGGYGEYGFYEALDLEGDSRVVTSYMTHHQGMSIVALCNHLTEGILREYFLSAPEIRAVKILLTETMPMRRVLHKIHDFSQKKLEKKGWYYEFIDKIEYSEAAVGLTDGTLSVYSEASGATLTTYNGVMINRYRKEAENEGGKHFFVLRENGKTVSPAYVSQKDDYNKYTFAYSPYGASYRNVAENVGWDSAVIGKLGITVDVLRAPQDKGKEVVFYEPLALSEYDAFHSHPAFQGLFLRIDRLEDGTLILYKRSKQNVPFYIAVCQRGLEEVTFETSRYEAIGRKRPINKGIMLENSVLSCDCGEVLEPCVSIRGRLKGTECEIVHIISTDYRALIHRLNSLPKDLYGFAMQSEDNLRISELTQKMLFPCMALPYGDDILDSMRKYGNYHFTKGKKMILYKMNDENAEPLKKLAESMAQLRYFGLFPQLVVLCSQRVSGEGVQLARRVLSVSTLIDYRVFREGKHPIGLEECAFRTVESNLEFTRKRYKNLEEIKEFNVKPVGFSSDIELDYESGFGGFSNGDYYLTSSPKLPYANVVGLSRGGFVATENGGGFQFFDNSKERCVTCFENDPVEDRPHEALYFSLNDFVYRVNGGAACQNVIYRRGSVIYHTKTKEGGIIAEKYMIADGDVAVWEIRATVAGVLRYRTELSMGTGLDSSFVYAKNNGNGITAYNLQNGYEIAFRLLGEGKYLSENNRISMETADAVQTVYVLCGKKERLDYLTEQEILAEKRTVLAYFTNLNNVRVISKDIAGDLLFNDWLLYQTVSSRLQAKTGYYQIGGATGFRDQLQDMLCLLLSEPERVRGQILYHAAHQYKEGDVMHWWHHPNFGLRSRISDDKLYLPFLVAEYIEVTGDKDILKESVPFLDSPPLTDWEHARFEQANAGESDSLHRHCLNAIRSALKYGEHNLLLLGGGDWNDGLDEIGKKGRAESVELSMFACEVLQKYAKLCDYDLKSELEAIAERMKETIDRVAFDGKQFMRLFGDDGVWYGTKSNRAFEIDLVVQSMAAMYGIGSLEHRKSALREAETLVNTEYGTIALLKPALGAEPYLGYISQYPKGIRENGGQYTHAAVWYLMALLDMGENEKAYRLFEAVNPILKCRGEGANRYGGEPFVLSGDVYTEKFAGRMGWSWYTGSASWMYYMILTKMYGIRKKGDFLAINPHLPQKLSGTRLEVKLDKTLVKIEYRVGEKKGVYENGKRLEKGGITLNGGERSLVVEY